MWKRRKGGAIKEEKEIFDISHLCKTSGERASLSDGTPVTRTTCTSNCIWLSLTDSARPSSDAATGSVVTDTCTPPRRTMSSTWLEAFLSCSASTD